MSVDLIVLNAVAVEINKENGSFIYELGNIWDTGNEHALSFVIEVEKKFNRKAKTYGFLGIDPRQESIPTILQALNEDSENHFISTARRMMSRLKSSLNDEGRGNTQVGHVVFIHYCNELEQDDHGRLLVIMVDKKEVFDFGEGLVPTQFKSIDVDTLRQAVLYDLTLFDAVYPEHVEEEQDQAYLRFISGKSKGLFFKEALGTTDIIDNTVSTSSIFGAIEDFGEDLGLPTAYIRKLQEDVELLIQEKNGKQISINSVAKRIIANLPEDNNDITVDDFVSFVNENDYKISEIFDVTRGQLQKATSIEGQKGQDFFYRVKKSALGSVDDEDDEKYVKYDAEKRLLYFEVQDEDEHEELKGALPRKE
jgi:nucleoid-associated protein